MFTLHVASFLNAQAAVFSTSRMHLTGHSRRPAASGELGMKLDQIRDTESEACICGTDSGTLRDCLEVFGWENKVICKKNVETDPDLTNSEGGLISVMRMMMVGHTDRGC